MPAKAPAAFASVHKSPFFLLKFASSDSICVLFLISHVASNSPYYSPPRRILLFVASANRVAKWFLGVEGGHVSSMTKLMAAVAGSGRKQSSVRKSLANHHPWGNHRLERGRGEKRRVDASFCPSGENSRPPRSAVALRRCTTHSSWGEEGARRAREWPIRKTRVLCKGLGHGATCLRAKRRDLCAFPLQEPGIPTKD